MNRINGYAYRLSIVETSTPALSFVAALMRCIPSVYVLSPNVSHWNTLDITCSEESLNQGFAVATQAIQSSPLPDGIKRMCLVRPRSKHGHISTYMRQSFWMDRNCLKVIRPIQLCRNLDLAPFQLMVCHFVNGDAIIGRSGISFWNVITRLRNATDQPPHLKDLLVWTFDLFPSTQFCTHILLHRIQEVSNALRLTPIQFVRLPRSWTTIQQYCDVHFGPEVSKRLNEDYGTNRHLYNIVHQAKFPMTHQELPHQAPFRSKQRHFSQQRKTRRNRRKAELQAS